MLAVFRCRKYVEGLVFRKRRLSSPRLQCEALGLSLSVEQVGLRLNLV
jgi:hypothetical protein